MTRPALLLAMLTGGLMASPALANKVTQFPGEMRVTDEARLFTAEGIDKAKENFQGQIFEGHVRFSVHTADSVPAAKQADFDAAKHNPSTRGQFFQDWAEELARKEGSKADVFVLLYRTDTAYYTKCISDRETDIGRGFTSDKAEQVMRRFATALSDALTQKLTGDALHAKMNTALADATHLVIEDLKNTSAPSGGHAVAHADRNANGGGGMMKYLCIGICVLAGVWLVFGLIRALSGGGGGGGYGGGGYGGGGGFGSSLMGGLFGTMAGMYMYNQFFGGGMSNLGASDSMSNDAGGYDTGDGDYSGGASAGDGGGDWGDGGGDMGGGGDWGDGGGDFGGGDFGGGDW